MVDDQLQFFIKQLANESDISLQQKGYAHLSLMVLPRLQIAERSKQFEEKLLSKCWTIIGGVYHINGAPLCAEMAYKKAMLFNAINLETLKCIIQVQIETGKFHEAFRNVNDALDIDPDNMTLFSERQRIQDDMNYESEPLYSSDDSVWALNESLANDKFDSVIHTVLGTDMSDELQLRCLARAYGALLRHGNCLEVWQIIQKNHFEAMPESADLFYCPYELRSQLDW